MRGQKRGREDSQGEKWSSKSLEQLHSMAIERDKNSR